LIYQNAAIVIIHCVLCVCVFEWGSVHVCVCKRKQAREKKLYVHMCIYSCINTHIHTYQKASIDTIQCVFVCVCVRERERERERVCVYVTERQRGRKCCEFTYAIFTYTYTHTHTHTKMPRQTSPKVCV